MDSAHLYGARWGSLAIESASMALRPGVKPSTADLVLVPTAGTDVSVDGTLTFFRRDKAGGTISATDSGTWAFQDCRAASMDWKQTPQGFQCTLTVRDWRWRWEYAQPISGEYNRRDLAGNLLADTPTASAYDLAGSLLEALGQAQYDLGDMPDDQYPHVQWLQASPAAELARLCDRFGCQVIPDPENSVYLLRPTSWSYMQGTSTNGSDCQGYDYRQDVEDLPASWRVVGQRQLHQVAVPLQGVYLDAGASGTSGTWKAMGTDTPSWGSWRWRLDSDVQLSSSGSVGAARALRLTAFRCYRPSGTTTASWIDPQDGATSRSTSWTPAQLPLHWRQDLVEREDGPDGERRAKAYVRGRHKRKYQAAMSLEERSMGTAATTSAGGRVATSFSLKTPPGVVWFSDQVFWPSAGTALTPSGTVHPAQLTLVCGVEGSASIYDYQVSGTQSTIADAYRVVRCKDLRWEFDADGTCVNRSQMIARAEQAIADELARYRGQSLSETYVYGGLRSTTASGARQEVVYRVSAYDAPSTTVTYCARTPRSAAMTARMARALSHLGESLTDSDADYARDIQDTDTAQQLEG